MLLEPKSIYRMILTRRSLSHPLLPDSLQLFPLLVEILDSASHDHVAESKVNSLSKGIRPIFQTRSLGC